MEERDQLLNRVGSILLNNDDGKKRTQLLNRVGSILLNNDVEKVALNYYMKLANYIK